MTTGHNSAGCGSADCSCAESTPRRRVGWWLVLGALLTLAIILALITDARPRPAGHGSSGSDSRLDDPAARVFLADRIAQPWAAFDTPW